MVRHKNPQSSAQDIFSSKKHSPILNRKISNQTTFLNPDHLLKEMAKKEGYSSPLEIMLKGENERAAFLNRFCNDALSSFSSIHIAAAINKWAYAETIAGYKDCTGGQAPQALEISLSKQNLSRARRNGIKIIIEGNVDASCTFGPKTTNHINLAESAGSHLYIIDDTASHDRPQATTLSIRGTCENWNDFNTEKMAVLAARKEFEAKIPTLVRRNRLKKSDEKHDETIKFSIFCAVFNKEDGVYYVVDDKPDAKPTVFSEWVKQNRNEILSASDDQLALIDAFINKHGGLMQKLRGQVPSVDAWKELKEDITTSHEQFSSLMKGSSLYRQAVKVWRCAFLQLQAEALDALTVRYKDLKLIEETLRVNVKLACDDGRDYGDIAVLGAIMSLKDFELNFLRNSPHMKVLQFVPHYGCGFLTNARKIHNVLTSLKAEIAKEENKFEQGIMMDFFHDLLITIGREGNNGDNSPVCEWRALRDRLPARFQDILNTIKNNPGIKIDGPDMEAVSLLHDLFAGENKKLRSVFFRAVQSRVFKRDVENGMFSMPAAAKVYKDLHNYGITDLSDTVVNALVSEEAARNAKQNYVNWLNAYNKSAESGKKKDFELQFFMENFKTGQLTIVPDEPTSAEDYRNFSRKDAILNKDFTQDEITQLGFNGKMSWNLLELEAPAKA